MVPTKNYSWEGKLEVFVERILTPLPVERGTCTRAWAQRGSGGPDSALPSSFGEDEASVSYSHT